MLAEAYAQWLVSIPVKQYHGRSLRVGRTLELDPIDLAIGRVTIKVRNLHVEL